jgi:cellulose synthase/poly-beta-1,6-N-acetylglucosamine synthase-like glycosyltransferase
MDVQPRAHRSSPLPAPSAGREPAGPRAGRGGPPRGGPPGEPALTPRQRTAHAAIGLLWLVVTARFWWFWLQPEHRGQPALYIVTTLALVYLSTLLPTFFWLFVGRMRRPERRLAPPGLRVAVITLCVPSHESLDVIEGQLRALTAIRYPHDSWILDEGGDPRVERLAAATGVRYFTRRGVPRWNRPEAPFQARTKAGNVNAWLDWLDVLGEEYEFFVQLDIDHRPVPEYLDRTLGHFGDARVAWVQAPSVPRNLDSWTARGLAELDLPLQGPLQMGFFGHSGTPFIIGSHTTYRMSAVREIGGFQPTRAEDHLDTVVLAAQGYRGIYLPEIIAAGDGPEDLGTYLRQQFAWAYSMMQILLYHTPHLLLRYSARQALQFFVAQSWYARWSLSMAILWVVPAVALLASVPITTVPLTEFLAYYLAVLATSTLMWWWCRPWYQPAGVRLSWRAVVLEIARWPVVLWAAVNAVLRIPRSYMITPKGSAATVLPSGRLLYGPYFGLAGLGIGAVLGFVVVVGHSPTQGYLGLVLLNVAAELVLLVTAIALELRALRRTLGDWRPALRARAAVLVWLAVLCTASAVATVLAWGAVAEVIG